MVFQFSCEEQELELELEQQLSCRGVEANVARNTFCCLMNAFPRCTNLEIGTSTLC